MPKITIEYDDAAGIKVDQSQTASSSASISDAEGGAAPGDSSPDSAPARFDRFAEDAVDAGGPPEWLFTAIRESLAAPDSAPAPGDDAIDGGAAPEG